MITSRLNKEPLPLPAKGNRLNGSSRNPYGSVFWFSYIANTALMVAVSLLFRYADFVNFLEGGEMQLGLIVGVGMIGSILMRIVQGVGIDRYGSRLVWLLSLVLFVISMLAHLLVTTVDGPMIYFVRLLTASSIAGAFGASITYISLRVPETRMAEMIGTLGTSGFIGMAIGPALGDYLFDVETITRVHLDRMFWGAALLGGFSLLCAFLGTWRNVHIVPRRRPPMLWLVRRYHPGPFLLVAAAMGIGISLPHIFLRAYTSDLQIQNIKLFFWVYCLTAFVIRIATRRLTGRIGFRPVILMGLVSLASSMILYLLVSSETWLIAPAIFAGTAHAFLFPAVMAGGSVSFPSRYRGLATTLMLMMFDIGNLLGQPLAGSLVQTAKLFDLPAYPILFLSMSSILAAVALFYFFFGRNEQQLLAYTESIVVEAERTGGEVDAVCLVDRCDNDSSVSVQPSNSDR